LADQAVPDTSTAAQAYQLLEFWAIILEPCKEIWEFFLHLFLIYGDFKSQNSLHFTILSFLFLLFGEVSSVRKKGWNFLLAHSALVQHWQISKQFEAAAADQQPCFLLKHPFRIFGYLLEPCTEIWKIFFRYF